jgi:hypothetical protein
MQPSILISAAAALYALGGKANKTKALAAKSCDTCYRFFGV